MEYNMIHPRISKSELFGVKNYFKERYKDWNDVHIVAVGIQKINGVESDGKCIWNGNDYEEYLTVYYLYNYVNRPEQKFIEDMKELGAFNKYLSYWISTYCPGDGYKWFLFDDGKEVEVEYGEL